MAGSRLRTLKMPSRHRATQASLCQDPKEKSMTSERAISEMPETSRQGRHEAAV
jgi:hypothetical protein